MLHSPSSWQARACAAVQAKLERLPCHPPHHSRPAFFPKADTGHVVRPVMHCIPVLTIAHVHHGVAERASEREQGLGGSHLSYSNPNPPPSSARHRCSMVPGYVMLLWTVLGTVVLLVPGAHGISSCHHPPDQHNTTDVHGPALPNPVDTQWSMNPASCDGGRG